MLPVLACGRMKKNSFLSSIPGVAIPGAKATLNFVFRICVTIPQKKNILVDFQMALEIGHALAEPIELKGEISTAFVLGAQYPVQCLIPSEHSPQAILKGTHEVQNAFFDKMNECINSLEVRLRKPII